MPDITKQENDLLQTLTGHKVPTIGKPRTKQAAAFMRRLMFLADKAQQEKRDAELIANGLWLTACGKLTEADILANPNITAEQRDDLLKLLQLRYDAEAWRAHCELDLPELPSVVTSPSTQYIRSNEEVATPTR